MGRHDLLQNDGNVTADCAEWWTAVNWIVTFGFAVVAVDWTCCYFAARRTNPLPPASQLARLELPCHVFTAAGTTLMFGAMV